MRGQWQGTFDGYAKGYLTIEIDEHDQHFSGRACLFEEGNQVVVFVVEFASVDKAPTQVVRSSISIQRIADANEVSRSEIQQAFPESVIPERVELALNLTQKGLRAVATTYSDQTPIGKLTAFLNKGAADKKSKLAADKRTRTWEKFKVMVGRLPPDRYMFRGQPVSNRLRTSFHRTNRRNLHRFLNHDIPMLHGIVTSKTSHYFDLKDNIQNAAFWNLLQHHGYPTPLLDWTHSPYVAAYFAFREKAAAAVDPKRTIRIFMFDRAEWVKDYRQLSSVVNVRPHFSILNPISLENPRALPQQAVCSITTVDDVETYLELCGEVGGKTYLKVFELPYIQRAEVLTDLRLMGVSAGSLFPGIDGACEEMRLKNFGVG